MASKPRAAAAQPKTAAAQPATGGTKTADPATQQSSTKTSHNGRMPKTYKVVMLGESAVGKTSLVLRYVKGQFREFQESTVGVASLTQTVCVDDSTVTFEIWDTAGQEKYHSLAPMYYRGTQAAIVVYDITRTDSFAASKNWVAELEQKEGKTGAVALIGNKADLTGRRAVELEEAERYAEDHDLMFFETSAKTSANVNEVFLAIAQRLNGSDGGSRKRTTETDQKRPAANENSKKDPKGTDPQKTHPRPPARSGSVASARSDDDIIDIQQAEQPPEKKKGGC